MKRKIIKSILFILLVYLVSWTVSYAAVMQFNFKYYFQYFFTPWGHAGEYLAFINLFAVSLTVIVLLISIVVILFKRMVKMRSTTLAQKNEEFGASKKTT